MSCSLISSCAGCGEQKAQPGLSFLSPTPFPGSPLLAEGTRTEQGSHRPLHGLSLFCCQLLRADTALMVQPAPGMWLLLHLPCSPHLPPDTSTLFGISSLTPARRENVSCQPNSSNRDRYCQRCENGPSQLYGKAPCSHQTRPRRYQRGVWALCPSTAELTLGSLL